MKQRMGIVQKQVAVGREFKVSRKSRILFVFTCTVVEFINHIVPTPSLALMQETVKETKRF